MTDWNVAIEWATLPRWRLEEQMRIRKVLADLGQKRAQDAAQSDPPPEPESAEETQGLAPTAAASAPVLRSAPDPKRAPDPVDMLAQALDAASGDSQRAELLAAAPRQVREQLNARLQYHALMRAADEDPYAELVQALGTAGDDAVRRALISGRDAAFLAEWAWRIRATADDWRRRYFETIDVNENGDPTV